MKKKFLIIPLLCLGMGLTACGGVLISGNNQGNSSSETGTSTQIPVEVQTSFDKFVIAFKDVVKNDNNIAPELMSYKDCEFTGYTIKRDAEDANKGTLNMYGKVYNNTNTYNSYLTLSYADVALDSIFTQDKATEAENKAEWYTNMEDFIKTADYDYYIENKVQSFDDFNAAVKTIVPTTASQVHGKLESVDIKALNQGMHDEESEQYRFSFYTENIYCYTTGGQKISNATIMKMNITMDMTNQEYIENSNNPSYYVDKLIYCINNHDQNWGCKKTVVGVIETEVNGADMGIELE